MNLIQEYVTKRCPFCGETGTIRARVEGMQAWQKGALIQHALPELTPAQREQLITGFHPECFEDAFPPEPEPEECHFCKEDLGFDDALGEFVVDGKHVLAHAECGSEAGMELA